MASSEQQPVNQHREDAEHLADLASGSHGRRTYSELIGAAKVAATLAVVEELRLSRLSALQIHADQMSARAESRDHEHAH